jgi:anti-anti-sigma factor
MTSYSSKQSITSAQPPADDPLLVWSVSGDGPRTRLTVGGELTAMTAARLGEALQWLSDRGCQRITMDVAGIRRCDCAGVDALIASLHQVTVTHGHVLLTNPSDELRRLLGLSSQHPPSQSPEVT